MWAFNLTDMIDSVVNSVCCFCIKTVATVMTLKKIQSYFRIKFEQDLLSQDCQRFPLQI